MHDWRDFISLSGGDVKEVYWKNGKLIADCVKDVDGYWKVWFAPVEGLWDGHVFEVLAAMLTDLNAEWDAEIGREFGLSDQ